MTAKKEACPNEQAGLLCNTVKQGEDTHRATQLKTIFYYLQDHVCTAAMVEKATGIRICCITRYKRDLEKAGRLWELFKGKCQRTGHLAWYLTTNPDKAPKQANQLTLFNQ